MKVWETYYRHRAVPIGAYRGSAGRPGASGGWSRSVRDAFDPGDTSANYPDCVTAYRIALASAANAGVTIVETGFPTCLVQVMRSAADAVSARTGAQLLRTKVKALYVMGGDYPGPYTEFNFQNSAAESSYLFAKWTTRNGYPPIYLNGYTPGLGVPASIPGWFPRGHPAMTAQASARVASRPSWDLLSVYQGIFGTRAFTVSANGTNSVDASTGRNRWRGTPASGHYYVGLSHPAEYYRSLLSLNPGTTK
jgi:hypothetical protein